jgi:hypothetical protein
MANVDVKVAHLTGDPWQVELSCAHRIGRRCSNMTSVRGCVLTVVGSEVCVKHLHAASLPQQFVFML